MTIKKHGYSKARHDRCRCNICKRALYEYNSAYRKKHLKSELERLKKYRTNHKDELRAYRKRYYGDNAEIIRLKRKEYYATNKTKAAAYRRKYYIDNREILLEKTRRWKKHNPETVNALNSKYRALKLGAQGSYTSEQWKTLCKNQKHKCLSCGRRRRLTVDHIVPLTSGGTNFITNIQGLCTSCNSSKGVKTIDFRIAIGGSG